MLSKFAEDGHPMVVTASAQAAASCTKIGVLSKTSRPQASQFTFPDAGLVYHGENPADPLTR